jgi:hypothetical protein
VSETQIIYEPFKTKPLSDFLEELRFEFPTLPEQLFQFYLRKAARTMSREGNLVRRRAVIALQHCVTRYRLESPDGLELCGIRRAYILPEGCCDGTVLKRTFSQPEKVCPCGRGIVWYDDVDKVLHVKHNLTHGDLLVELAVMPAQDACELPDALYNDWLDPLLMGVRAYIMLIPGRPWTNVQLGRAYMQEFEGRIKSAAVETATHKMRGSIKMRSGRVL